MAAHEAATLLASAVQRTSILPLMYVHIGRPLLKSSLANVFQIPSGVDVGEFLRQRFAFSKSFITLAHSLQRT